jgi:hypothetical protein
LFAQVPGGVLAGLFERLRRHRGRPRVGYRLTGCSMAAVKRGSAALPHLTFYLQNGTFWRADERTRSAYPCSLRVCGQWLLSVAGVCKFRISKRFSVLSIARHCRALRQVRVKLGSRNVGQVSLVPVPTNSAMRISVGAAYYWTGALVLLR